jgi:ABC-2 type transport system ATP-binding protein
MYALQAHNISKIYKNSFQKAVDNLSVEIPVGKIFTMLGRNGAGKTTFVRMCATQLLPSTGTISVLGYDIIKETNKIRKLISIVPQEGRPLRALTAWDHVYYWLRIRGESKNVAKSKAEEMLERLELGEVKNRPAMNLSGGMKQKILVAMAMAVDAQLLFLDEPTIGLDPVSRRQVWTAIKEWKKEGRTIFLTTHYMDEAELLSDSIFIIDKGKEIASGTINDLRRHIPQNIRIDLSVGNGFDIELLKSFGTVVDIATDKYRVFTYEKYINEISTIALKHNLPFSVSPITLDDVFVSIVDFEHKDSNI